MVWYGVVWCGVVWCGVVWCGVVWCGVVWCGVVWCGVVWCGGVWCGVVWCGVVWCGVVWYGMVVVNLEMSSGTVWCQRPSWTLHLRFQIFKSILRMQISRQPVTSREKKNVAHILLSRALNKK